MGAHRGIVHACATRLGVGRQEEQQSRNLEERRGHREGGNGQGFTQPVEFPGECGVFPACFLESRFETGAEIGGFARLIQAFAQGRFECAHRAAQVFNRVSAAFE